MKINISEEMAETAISALHYACEKIGPDVEFGQGDYTVSYEEALWFFSELRDEMRERSLGFRQP
jgi:hypothetical protein